MTDIIERLRGYSQTAANGIMHEAADEIERLRGLLRHANDVVIWENTLARSGFQEEIEDALGITSPSLTQEGDVP